MNEEREEIYKDQILDTLTYMIHIIVTADVLNAGGVDNIWYTPTISKRSLERLMEAREKLKAVFSGDRLIG